MKTIRKLFAIFLISVKNHTVYIHDVIWKNISYTIRVLIILTLYKAIYKMWWGKYTTYTIEQVAWWLIFVQALVLWRPLITDDIAQDVKSWNISVYLLNPLSYLSFAFVRNMTLYIYNAVICMSVWLILWYFYIWLWDISIRSIIFWFLLFAWSMLTQFFAYLLIWLMSFYFEEIEWFRMIYNFLDRVLGWNILPIPFFPEIVQKFIYISPFAYTWFTSWLIFAKFEPIAYRYMLIQWIWIIIFFLSAVLISLHSKKYITINWW